LVAVVILVPDQLLLLLLLLLHTTAYRADNRLQASTCGSCILQLCAVWLSQHNCCNMPQPPLLLLLLLLLILLLLLLLLLQDLADYQYSQLPDGVFDLTNLQELSLAGNQLQHLPSEISRFV
jgi:hypothetical protein